MAKKQLVKTVFNIFYQIISTSVIVIGIILVAIYLCGIRMYNVKSGSMGELLPVGSVCFVSTYSDYNTVQVGDVISFRMSENVFVTHRAIIVTENGITTKGDENENPDSDFVTKENYIGKTVFAVPYVGYLVGWFHTTAGKITIVVSIVLLVIMGTFYRQDGEEEMYVAENVYEGSVPKE